MYNSWLDKDFEKIFNNIFLYHLRCIANKEGIEYIEKIRPKPLHLKFIG